MKSSPDDRSTVDHFSCLARRIATTGLALALSCTLPALASDSQPAGIDPAKTPWGDVDADGVVTMADATLALTFTKTPGSLTPAQQDRIRRYGDIAGVVNRSDVGNARVDNQDVMRLALLSGGIIDPGTAGVTHQGYGDVDGDGQATIADSLRVCRSINGREISPPLLARIGAAGGGDVSPTIPYISFGDGAINTADVDLIADRALGTETNAPAYVDYWPAHFPTVAHPAVLPDQHTLVDVNGFTGDILHQTIYVTQAVQEIRGYSVTRIAGSDNSIAGIFKGMDGSIYAMFIQYKQAMANRRIDFLSPIKLLDAAAAGGEGGPWSGKVTGDVKDYGVRPVIYRGAVLSNGDVYTSAAGNYPSGDPASNWSKTVRIRLDVGLLAGQGGTGSNAAVEMQQAFFFDLMPHIGLVGRGQASLMGSPAPTDDRSRLELHAVRVRGRQYTQTKP